ncbi:MAG: SDR family oxidoreductase [Sedimenticola sp.]
MKLNGYVALVTGASGGIGSEICKILASEGASLVLHYHSSKEKCLALEKELNRLAVVPQQTFTCIYADLVNEKDACGLVKKVIERFDRLDILINNAGWSRHVPADDLAGLDEELIDLTIRLKVQAPLYLVRASREYLERSPAGHVINITSVAGIVSKGSSIIYAAANAALTSLTRSLARILSPAVRVNAIAPGFVETGFVWPKDGKYKQQVSKNNYIGRAVEAGEIAQLVRFLVCDAQAITGEEIVVDGGIGRLGKK